MLAIIMKVQNVKTDLHFVLYLGALFYANVTAIVISARLMRLTTKRRQILSYNTTIGVHHNNTTHTLFGHVYV